MKYVALIRGIGPGNPDMHGARLKEYFEHLGFTHVKPVISSGNVVFETTETDPKKLEEKIEAKLLDFLGFFKDTIVISEDALLKLVKKDPFKGLEDRPSNNLNVTFLKYPTNIKLTFPHHPERRGYKLLQIYDKRVITSFIDMEHERTPDLMVYLEKVYGRQITTRTWKTLHRILKAMESL